MDGAVAQHISGEEQLDRQQVLEQIECRVGLAYAQRRAGGVVLHAEVQRRRVERSRPGELFEFGEHRRGRVSQLLTRTRPSARWSAGGRMRPRGGTSGAR